MTDKRFTEFEINDNVVEFKDDGVRDWYVEIELQTLLNDLNNENKDLKQENKELRNIIDTISSDYETEFGMSIKDADWFTAW